MESIKNSFANCSVCSLLEEPSCIMETNCKDDLSKVDVIFIAENPGKDEVKKGVPLIGKAGKMFRKYFTKYGINKLNYLLTNVVLCQTLNEDGTTGNPEPEVIERCKINCMSIIKACNPKLIVLMGTSPMSAFGVAKAGITNLHGKVTDWQGFKTVVIVHPSFVNRNIHVWEPKFEDGMEIISNILTGKHTQTKHSSDLKTAGKGMFRYKIPEHFYTDKYRLIDIQYLTKANQVLYIFRDENNNKIYHRESDDYVCYQVPKGQDAKKILPFDKVNQIMIKYKNRYDLDPDITYEGDVKITAKHAMDYYHFSKGEAKKDKSNIMFFDIEIDTGDSRSFPQPTEALFPINMLTTIYNGNTICYVVDNHTEPLKKKENVTYKVFETEKALLQSFIKDYKNTEPDFLAGWNCIDENGLIFLNDRISPIRSLTKNLKLKDGSVINKHAYTGMKIPYEIKLKNGSFIYSSEDHIFPYYKKEKEKYYTPEKLLNNRYENRLRKIITEDDDIYLKLDLCKNTNKDYSWGDYIKENLDKLLSLDFIDIKIISNNLREKVKNTGYHKEKLERQEYWQGKEFYKHSFWSYKNLSHIISKQDIINQLDEHEIQTFKVGKNYNLDVNMNDIIKDDHLKLLGFMYTDGFWSNYDKGFCFDNKDYDTINNYNLIMNEFRRFPFDDISHKWNKRDELYTLGIGLTSKFTLLIAMVYNTDLKKNIDVEILSRLSQKQFASFFSGLIDGDGSLLPTEVNISCFENNGEDSKLIQTLLSWNGVFSYHRPNNIMIPRITFNKFFFEELTPFHSKRKFITETENLREPKNSCSNIIDKFYYDEFVLVKIDEIKKIDQQVNMYDIETELHYFLYNGVETHNCISFDLTYIFNRLPQIGLKQESFTKFKEFYVDGERYICHIPGSVAIDQDFLYRTFTFTKMENYKLGFIAAHELDGITKLDLPLPFNEMYWKMFNLTVEYNIRDTELLDKLENKLAHINLMNELRVICNTSFDSVSSHGQIDSLMVSYLKNKGFASKNSDPHIIKEKYPGAYVHQPIPGAYDWITDFDFASLYPSIMITYNIGVNSYVMKLKDPSLGFDLAYRPEVLPKKIKVIIDPLFKKQEMTITPEQLLDKIKSDNLVYTINGCFFLPHKKEFSVFGEVVDMLMSTRKEYKGKMFDAIEAKKKDEETFFYTRQLVYKVLANTLYGVVAMKHFRFFDTSLAAAITLSGQEALKTSIIEGDAFMRHLDTGKPYVSPKPLTKKEMYSEEMPERGNEYIVTGDTDSIFCKFGDFDKKKHEINVQNIHKWCAEIEEFLNEDKIVEVVKRHNVDMDFNRMKLKNELVISRGLFLAKKRYAIRVINNEGKDVDKINYMGVEIKRSDYPNKSKEFLSELLELILKDEKLKLGKTITYVARKEKEFKKLIIAGDKSIARPVTYGKKLKDYKSLPQGVRAMEAWNSIMYNIHKTGNKAYMFWVRGIDFEKIPDPKMRAEIQEKYDKFIAKGNKLEVIAIPDEEARLPEFFVPDLKAALKFSFEDRHQLMLKPLTNVSEATALLTV